MNESKLIPIKLQYLDYQKSTELSRENFTFSCRVILGDYLQPVPPEYATEGEFVRLTEDDVNRRYIFSSCLRFNKIIYIREMEIIC